MTFSLSKFKRAHVGFLLCGAAFLAAVAGSYYCGQELLRSDLSDVRAKELWNLIYFHFALSQLSLVAAALLFYFQLIKSNRYYLVVSYAPSAVGIAPPGIELPAGRSYFASLATLRQSKLPPLGREVLVFPMMMQSGYSSSERLVEEIQQAYIAQGMRAPRLRLIMQPVLGASPWLAQIIAERLRAEIGEGDGVLVVAHDTAPTQSPAPEPELLCQRLRRHFPNHPVVLTRFGEHEQREAPLRSISARRVHILPFLMSEGYHTRHDLPTQEQARDCGKELVYHPVVAELMKKENSTPME